MEQKKYGSFLERLAAYLFDWLLISLIPLVILLIAVNNTTSVNQFWLNSLWFLGEIIFFQWLINWTYLIMTFLWFNGSIGKILAGLRIVKEDNQKPVLMDALMRFPVGYTVSTALYYLGFLWMIKDIKKQALHDHFAKTTVIKKEPAWPVFIGLPVLFLINVFLVITIIKSGQTNGLWREISLDSQVFSRKVQDLLRQEQPEKKIKISPTPFQLP